MIIEFPGTFFFLYKLGIVEFRGLGFIIEGGGP